MKTFSITSLGCKVNQYEGQRIRGFLENLGLHFVDQQDSSADLIVVNTCCVTNTASAKSRRQIRRAMRHNRSATVVACGCMPVLENNLLKAQSARLHAVTNRAGLGELLIHAAGIHGDIMPYNNAPIKTESDTGDPLGPPLKTFSGHTRAFVKVQDGCDGYCSYCVIPYTRPTVSYRPLGEIIEEVRLLVAAGHREIVLAGIFLGAYGRLTTLRRRWPGGRNDRLAELLEAVAAVDGLERIRLSSLEPGDITDRLLEVIRENANIMPHFHLPLQSGSNTVLGKMCRQYRVNDFLKSVEMVNSAMDRPALTTDIIAGFPGETEADFQDTLGLAEKVGFAKIHVFAYSLRHRTAAAKFPGRLDSRTVKERSLMLRQLDQRLAVDFRRRFVGEMARVLVEQAGDRPQGRSERYFMVAIDHADGIKKNDIVDVRITAAGDCAAVGRPAPGRPEQYPIQPLLRNRGIG